MRILSVVVGVLLLLRTPHAAPVAELLMPRSDEEAIVMAKQECSAALATYGSAANTLEWHVSRHNGRWFVGAQKGAHYFMAVFPKFRPCISGLQTE
jgi:hypothetical protein